MADLARAAGRVVAVPLAGLARVRRAKPMHPEGVVFAAVLTRRPLGVGVPWLDTAGTDDVLVRLSRGAGLPARLPDLLGFALRLPGNPPVDLLLSSTGRGRWTRLVPVPRRDAAAGYGSIMASRSTAGPVWLAALPQGGPLPSDAARLPRRPPDAVAAPAAPGAAAPWAEAPWAEAPWAEAPRPPVVPRRTPLRHRADLASGHAHSRTHHRTHRLDL